MKPNNHKTKVNNLCFNGFKQGRSPLKEWIECTIVKRLFIDLRSKRNICNNNTHELTINVSPNQTKNQSFKTIFAIWVFDKCYFV